MLSGAGGGAETSLGERRRTQDARQRESAPPHFHSSYAARRGPGPFLRRQGPIVPAPCPILPALHRARRQEPRPPDCHVERIRNISRGTSAYPRRSPERVRASPSSSALRCPTRPRAILVKIAPHRSCTLPRRSCGGRNLAPLGSVVPAEAGTTPYGCHVERSRNISRGTSAYPRHTPERVRASPFSSPYAARRGPGPFLRRQGPRSHPHPVHPVQPCYPDQ